MGAAVVGEQERLSEEARRREGHPSVDLAPVEEACPVVVPPRADVSQGVSLIALQRTAGNAAVGRLIARSRLGGSWSSGEGDDEVDAGFRMFVRSQGLVPILIRDPQDGTASKKEADKKESQSDAPRFRPVQAPSLAVIARSPATDAIAALDNPAGADLKGAFDKLTPLAMFDLLPALLNILQAGKLGPIEANASGMAGPRMMLAIKVVKLKQPAVKLTEPIIDGLIDDMEQLPPDQRTDMFRFLGVTASIMVDGFEVTFAYTKGVTGASCEPDLLDAIDWSKKMQAEYTAAGAKKGMKTGTDIENAVHASLAAKGIGTTVAGSTSSSGTVTVAATSMTKSQPILTRGTEIHEAEHATHTLALQKKYGGKTAAFKKVWDSAADWWTDEVRAYGAEIPFYQKVIAAIRKLEKLKSTP
jgi:hypothetical protein